MSWKFAQKISTKNIYQSRVTTYTAVAKNGSFPGDVKLGSKGDKSVKNYHEAKARASIVFADLRAFCQEFEKNLTSVKDIPISDVLRQNLAKDIIKAETVIQALKSDKLKVFVFGKTSSGKSALINALLKRKVLPSTMGHTTNCCIQLEGTEGNIYEWEIVKDDQIVKQKQSTLHEIKQFILEKTSALEEGVLHQEDCLKVFLPKQEYELLQNDIVLIDSPGKGYTRSGDKAIGGYCKDVDVAILVDNAESAVSFNEKEMLQEVKERFSTPYLLCVVNKSDMFDNLERREKERIKKQHIVENVGLLVKIHKGIDDQEAQKRIYFISAMEELGSSLGQKEKKENDAVQARHASFARFEEDLKDSVSKGALRGRLKEHVEFAYDAILKKYNPGTQDMADLTNVLENKRKETNDSLETTKEILSHEEAEQQKENGRRDRDLKNKIETIRKNNDDLKWKYGSAAGVASGIASLIIYPLTLPAAALAAGLGYGYGDSKDESIIEDKEREAKKQWEESFKFQRQKEKERIEELKSKITSLTRDLSMIKEEEKCIKHLRGKHEGISKRVKHLLEDMALWQLQEKSMSKL